MIKTLHQIVESWLHEKTTQKPTKLLEETTPLSLEKLEFRTKFMYNNFQYKKPFGILHTSYTEAKLSWKWMSLITSKWNDKSKNGKKLNFRDLSSQAWLIPLHQVHSTFLELITTPISIVYFFEQNKKYIKKVGKAFCNKRKLMTDSAENTINSLLCISNLIIHYRKKAEV